MKLAPQEVLGKGFDTKSGKVTLGYLPNIVLIVLPLSQSLCSSLKDKASI